MSGSEITVGALAGKELFKPLVTDLYRFLVDRTGRKIKEWNTDRKISTLYRKISLAGRVKTIWQVDKAVDLTEFYCDSHIIQKKTRRIVRNLDDFRTKDNLLIEGVAGQGKSILLRYLCVRELARGKYIPIFVELRRIDSTHSLMGRIYTAFEALGLSVDSTLFDALASSGKILLLLDAFDEVPDYAKGSVLTDIEDLASTRSNLRMIVTARPHQTIKSSVQLTAVKLADLKGQEYVTVISRLAGTTAWGKGLADHIEKEAPHLKDLLTTPLIVTLLVILYKSHSTLPAEVSEFYDALFPTLLQRHDGTKPGFTRPRRCDLDDRQYRLAFEALCIFIKKSDAQSLSEDKIHTATNDALKHCRFDESPSAFVSDVVGITCLILQEGDEYRFIHRTVQEYYTTAFIKRRPDVWIRQFYNRILRKDNYRNWQQELQFLAEIDEYRYNEYYFLPAVLSFFECSLEDLVAGRQPPLRRVLEKHLRRQLLIVSSDGSYRWYYGLGTFIYTDLVERLDKVLHPREDLNEAILAEHIVPSRVEVEELWASIRTMFPEDLSIETDKFILGIDLLQDPDITHRLENSIRDFCGHLWDRAGGIAESIRKDQDPSLLNGLI